MTLHLIHSLSFLKTIHIPMVIYLNKSADPCHLMQRSVVIFPEILKHPHLIVG
eukprot:UN08223